MQAACRRRTVDIFQVAGTKCDQTSQTSTGDQPWNLSFYPTLAIAMLTWVSSIPGNPFIAAAKTDSCLLMPRVHQLIEGLVIQLITDMAKTHRGVGVQRGNDSEQAPHVIHRRRQDLVPPPASTQSTGVSLFTIDHHQPGLLDRAHQWDPLLVTGGWTVQIEASGNGFTATKAIPPMKTQMRQSSCCRQSARCG